MAKLDDILIYSKSFEDHLDHRRAVLNRVEEANGTLQAKKCQFAKQSLKQLGMVITVQGRHPDPAKAEAIHQIERPKEKAELRSWFATMTVYNHHINGFASMMAPLHELLKKNAEFVWKPVHEAAFQKGKAALTSDFLLIHADPSEAFVVHTGASMKGIGGKLPCYVFLSQAPRC